MSDAAKVLDVSTASEAEREERIAAAFGHAATADDLELDRVGLGAEDMSCKMHYMEHPRSGA